MPTKWRSYRDHRLCDVTSPYVYSIHNSGMTHRLVMGEPQNPILTELTLHTPSVIDCRLATVTISEHSLTTVFPMCWYWVLRNKACVPADTPNSPNFCTNSVHFAFFFHIRIPLPCSLFCHRIEQFSNIQLTQCYLRIRRRLPP